MKCKDCADITCRHCTTDAEMECCYSQYSQPLASQTKEQWISDTTLRLIANIPYEYVTSGVGTMEPRHIYAARIAKEMADVIFG